MGDHERFWPPIYRVDSIMNFLGVSLIFRNFAHKLNST